MHAYGLKFSALASSFNPSQCINSVNIQDLEYISCSRYSFTCIGHLKNPTKQENLAPSPPLPPLSPPFKKKKPHQKHYKPIKQGRMEMLIKVKAST